MSFYEKPKVYKLSWIAGDTEYFQVKYLKSDKVTPVDFTGATLTMQLRTTQTAATPSLTIAGAFDQETGIITFKASPTDTRTLSTALENKYFFDVQFENSEKTKTLAGGRILVKSDITR